MKIFDAIQSFFSSIGEYVKNFSMLFWIFLGAFLAVSFVVIVITSFAYECQLTKTIDKINKFLERNPRINDDNLVSFNNMMKAHSVPKILRRQWQQFMLYREHSASHYMSFKHCVENPMRNSTYSQQMTVYKIISYILVVLSLVVSTFMAEESSKANLVFQDIVIIPIIILVAYWLISMVLNLIHSAISGDLFQNYQYFEINMDKAMLTLPEFVDYEVLFSQNEIKRGIPVLFAYLQKRAIQEQQELEKARLKSSDHEKFDFDKAGLDGSLVLDRAMRETENFSTQRKNYLQEIERVNNEIAVLENNYKEQIKDYQRQVQTSKETVENLKEQLEQATSTIEINYIKKQMRDEINRQQIAEKDFDILTDKHNQEIKALNQEIKHYDEETKKAKEALETSMLSEFNTYSVKVYDNLEKIVDEKMQAKVDDYKDQIKGLEIQLEEKNEELENVYTRYQEVLAQVPGEVQEIEETYTEIPSKKSRRKKKNIPVGEPEDMGMVQPEQVDQYQPEYTEQYANDEPQAQDYAAYEPAQEYASNDTYSYDDQAYDNAQPSFDYYNQGYEASNYQTYDNPEYSEYANQDDGYDNSQAFDAQQTYVPLAEEQYNEPFGEEYQPATEYNYAEQPAEEQYVDTQDTYAPAESEPEIAAEPEKEVGFKDADFDIDFDSDTTDTDSFDNMAFSFDLDDKQEPQTEVEPEPQPEPEQQDDEFDDADFDLDEALGLYDNVSSKKNDDKTVEQDIDDLFGSAFDDEDQDADVEDWEDSLPSPMQPKRKAGRPRKEVQEDEDKPKRGVGRPRKVVEEDELDTPKRGRGRPRKEDTVEKRGPGRPRKEDDELGAPKRGRGRPRKEGVAPASTGRRGRPRKDGSVGAKRGVGRPPKSTGKRGRPSKSSTAKRGVGRPPKAAGAKTATKRRVGRPRKDW